MLTNSWPFTEAKKLLEHTATKSEVVFECGYGPSGLPHIGTFAEVVRTIMVQHAFSTLSDKPTRLIIFSDDMDALRKVPENIPNQAVLKNFIGVPLSSVPDPFEKYESFAAHNNAMLREFLDQYEFKYEFLSATQCYKTGIFNDTLISISQNLEQIKNLITRGYKADRINSYCPFLPIHHNKTYHEVHDWTMYANGLPTPFLHWFKNSRSEPFPGPDDRIDVVTPIINGNIKCQWKLDWPMRWIAFGVDYEMHGKDLLDSANIGYDICKLMHKTAPLTFMYELFLDENGEKISKSRGNGLNISDWWRYATDDVLSYFMFANPRKARRLHFDVIPKTTDEYMRAVDEYHLHPNRDNGVWHVHNGDVPDITSPVQFGLLVNLVGITNTSDPEMLWKYVIGYCPDASPEKYPMLQELITRAINYYDDRILPNKIYRTPDQFETNTLRLLCETLRLTEETEEAITIAIYDVGKQTYGEAKLREYFQMIYEVLMGQPSGPRFSIFVIIYGVENTIKAIEEKLV